MKPIFQKSIEFGNVQIDIYREKIDNHPDDSPERLLYIGDQCLFVTSVDHLEDVITHLSTAESYRI